MAAFNREQVLVAFSGLKLQTFVQELLGFKNALVESCEQVFGPLNHVLVEFGRIVAGHSLMPNVNDDEDVLDSHALQQRKQLLTTAFFVAVVIAFCHVRGLLTVSRLILPV